VGRKAEGPEIGGGVFKLEGDGEGAILGFADADDAAGFFGARGRMDQGQFVAFGELVANFEETSVGVDDEGEGVHGDEFSVVEASFQAEMYLQQHAFTAAAGFGIGAQLQVLARPPRLNLSLVATGFS